jgi:disulfide bond formation protein DsbB
MFQRYGLYCAWLLASIGTLGSLYFSEIRHFEPCYLCWYQRVCLFSLAITLGIATYRGELGIVRYALPLTVLGLWFSGYQIAIQEIPGWNPIDMCGTGPDCSEKVLIGLGPISLPMLSAANFLVLSILLTALWIKTPQNYSGNLR